MAREYKIEVVDGISYEFFLHDDGKIEFEGGINPIDIVHFKRSILHSEEMVSMMKAADLTRIEIVKL